MEVKSGKVRLENRDYFSLELKGVILPHIMQYLCNLLRETKDVFSISTASQPSTMSFSKAAHIMNQGKLFVLHKLSADRSTFRILLTGHKMELTNVLVN